MTATQRRTVKFAATAAFACLVGLSAAACGSEQEAPSSQSVATPPSDRSVPVVGGPKPATSTSSTDESRPSTPDDAKECGATKGPDGALQIHLVAGDVNCETAKEVAKEYSPLIATGTHQQVSGWDCGPSEYVGELSRCTKNDQAFALVP